MLAFYEIVCFLILVGWIYFGRKEEWDGFDLAGAIVFACLWPAFAVAMIFALFIGVDVRGEGD